MPLLVLFDGVVLARAGAARRSPRRRAVVVAPVAGGAPWWRPRWSATSRGGVDEDADPRTPGSLAATG